MDTIGEFITRLRNASKAKHAKVDIASSNTRKRITTLLQKEGFIRNFKVVNDGKQGMMRVYLKYNEKGVPAIGAIHRMSKPGRRYYVNAEKIPVVRSGFGMAVISTSKGILSGAQAKEQNLGGEYLLKLW